MEQDPSTETGISSYEITIVGILTQLALRKWLVAKVTGLAMIIGVIIALVLPNRYTAVAKLMPPQQSPSSASVLMNQIAGSSGGSLAGLAGFGPLRNPNAIYLGLLSSRPVADAVIRKFALVSVYKSKNMTAVRERLAKNTEIVSGKEEFILISVTDNDKKRAAEMANAYVQELRNLTQNLAVTEASQRRLFYEDQIKQAKEALVAAELSLQQIQQTRNLVQLDAQTRTMIEGLAALRAQIAAKEVELEALRSYSTEGNPTVQLAERQLSSLQTEAFRLEQRSRSSEGANMGLKDLPVAGLEYLRAEHELKYRQTMFDLLLKQYDVARLDESKQAAIVQVLEPAIEPDKKSSPHRLLILALSILTGLFVGCSIAFVKFWQTIPRSTNDQLNRLFNSLNTATR